MTYTTKICGEELSINNNVGLALIRQFEQRFPNDTNYVLGKADKIKEMDTTNCLLQWFNLDDEGKQGLVEQLGMPRDLLVQTCEGIKWLANN